MLVALALGCAHGAFAAGAREPVRMQSTCMSVSPLRAVPAVSDGADSLGPEAWRDLLLKELRRKRTDSAWFFRKAGECAESMATIDVFQNPDDVVSGAQGSAMRIRMEWRHAPGQTEFFVQIPRGGAVPLAEIAQQILVVSEQLLAMVEVASIPDGAEARWGSGEDARRAFCPFVLLSPPGPLSLELTLQGKVRRMDTVVAVGGYYSLREDFRVANLNAGVKFEPVKTWPLWALTLTSLLGGVWAAREQVVAQRAYSRLGPGESAKTFEARWDNLRTANVLRNGLFSVTVVFGLGTAWVEWTNLRKY